MKKNYISPHIEDLNINSSYTLLIGSKVLDEETTEAWVRYVDFDFEDDDLMEANE